MSSRNRRRRRDGLDSAAVGRVAAVAQARPDSPTARTGFANRVIGAAYPVVPAWIQWLYERNPELARWTYQLNYPPIDAQGRITGGWTAEEFWTRRRALWAEKEARKVVRANRFHSGGVVAAYSPALEDDDAFFAAWDAGRDWDGYWYSREPVGAAGW